MFSGTADFTRMGIASGVINLLTELFIQSIRSLIIRDLHDDRKSVVPLKERCLSCSKLI